MSLAQLQEATAFLVRFPEKGRNTEWAEFVARYDLTFREVAQLHHVAHSVQVVKYGKKLRKFRYVDVVEALPAPETILGEDLFETLWFDYFEPIAAGIATEDLADEFLQFLVQNESVRSLLARDAPEHASEFLTYLAAESALTHKGEAWRKRVLPAGSLLMHGAVLPLAFHYDVPKIIQNGSVKSLRHPKRTPKLLYYVFFLKEGETSPSLFAIDKEVYEFLGAQLVDPFKSPNRPGVYSALVRAGLCVP